MIELRNVSKRFGRVQANDHINIQVDPGTIHAIVGENGAGKSTAMRIAYGFYTADSGEILIDGQARTIATPHDAIALGIGMVHQHFMLVDRMTVAENIVLGAEPGTPLSLNLAAAGARIRKLSQEFGLSVDPDAVVEHLSVGQQQRVELLKALYRNARLLILDEPTAVLTPQEVDEFFGILRAMRAQGKTIVIITHKLSEVLAISDAVTVMRDGKVVGRVKTSETDAAALARLMVGREVLLRVEKPPSKPGAVVLSVRNFTVTSPAGAKRVDGMSFEVRSGEIVGIAGVEGNGQTELIEALAGLIDPANRPQWLGQEDLAMIAVAVVHAWRLFPFGVVIFLAGFTSVPQDVLDAATIDGAGFWRRNYQIILPIIAPIIMIALIFGTVFTFTDLSVVYLLTKGGPINSTQVLGSYAFQVGILSGDVAHGAAICLFLFPFLLVAVILLLRSLRRREI